MAMVADIGALVAGHICIDARHSDFTRQMQMVELLQPGMEYNRRGGLVRITNPLDKSNIAAVSEFIEECGEGVSTGGTVSNTGIPLGYLMDNVHLAARIGNDPFGEKVRQILEKMAPGRVHLSIAEGETTSYTIIVNDGSGQSMYAHYPGTNNTLSLDDVPMELVNRTGFFHFGYPNLMKVFYENDHALADMYQAIHEKGVRTYVDMHGFEPGEESTQADWLGILGNSLPYISVFCLNFDEALYLHDPGLFKKQVEDGKGFSDLPAEILQQMGDEFIRLGGHEVVIKCGDKGMYMYSEGTNGASDIFVPAYHTDTVVDTTGAGDNAVAALIAADARGRAASDRLHLANAAGSLNVSHRGSIRAFTSMRQLGEHMALAQPVEVDLGNTFTFDSEQDCYVGKFSRA